MKRSADHSRGYTLVEVIMAVVILIVLTSIGLITMTGERPKKKLVNTADMVAAVLNQAQVRAMNQGRTMGVCFKKEADGTYARVYRPQLDAIGNPTDEDCTPTDDELLSPYYFKKNVELCQNCDAQIAYDRSVFFDQSGYARLSNGSKYSYQLCLINDHLAKNFCSREVEATSAGIIKKVKPEEAGNIPSMQANQGNCNC